MLRLDPNLAVFRTSPDRIAIGAQAPVASLPADLLTLRALAALTRGVLRPELEQLIGVEEAAGLLATIAPALARTEPHPRVTVRGRIRLATEVHRAARAAGHAAGDDVLVPVAPWRLPDAELAHLVAQEAAWLPVTVGDAWVQVGPFVPAGAGCDRCWQAAPGTILPAHLVPEASPAAAAQTVVTVLQALARHGEGSLPEGWAVRIRQGDAAVSAVRRRRCGHAEAAVRARRGTAMAA